YYNEVGGDLLEQGCGTGPYKFVAVDLSTEVKLEAFDEYWECDVPIKNVILRPVTDSTTSAVSFEAGELDFIQVSNISAFQPLVDTGSFNTEAVTTLHTAYISMNNEVAPFDNKLVRQALTYAADRATMVAIAYEGLAVPARLMADERSFGVDFSNCPAYSYDLEKAKALLAEAGYPNGINFKEDFGVVMDIIPGGFYEKFATIFQQSLSEMGCTLELRASETYSADAASGNYAIITQGMTFQYDFSYDQGLYGTTGINSKNHARYSNPKVDELFTAADATTDQAQRAAYYKEICKILTDDCPTIPVLHKQMPYAWAKDLNAIPHVSAAHPYYVYQWSWN
ncbi:MAG: ABC transporter substrate-binding protein, partial [Clostridia bacterium]|nr:ABC transporter substrate-binding protein [Clostridia bacterium]